MHRCCRAELQQNTHCLCFLQDSTFDFERKRNRPVRYNRHLVDNTLKAMKKVAQIKQAREKRFYARRYRTRALCEVNCAYELCRVRGVRLRMKAQKEMQKQAEEAEIKQNIGLLAAPGAQTTLAQTQTVQAANEEARMETEK